MGEHYFFRTLSGGAIRKRFRKAKKKYICAGTLMLAVSLTAAFGSVSVLAETVSENQTPEEEVQGQELYEEAELTLSGYCGAENENGGKNVTYTISDSDNDGIYDLLEIKGNGRVRESDIANALNPGFGFELLKNPLPWQVNDNRMQLTKVMIGEGVTDIGYSLYRLSFLKEVSIPNSVTSIEMYAFYGCISLEKIIIPNSVTSIGMYAFWECNSLKEVSISDNVTLIQGGTFWNCSSLEKINIPDSVTIIRAHAFHDCRSLREISIQGTSIFIEDRAFSSLRTLVKVTLPDKGIAFIVNNANIEISEKISKVEYTNDHFPLLHISNISLGEGCTLVEIPNFLDNYCIDYVDENFRSLVSEEGHTHKYSETGICQICNKSKEQDEGAGIDGDIPEGPDTWKSKEGVEGFVFRLYNVAMNRDADEAGFNDWNTRLNTGKETAAEVARGFVLSDEFKNFGYNDVQYVKLLYRTMFGREADEGGLNDWLSKLENGMSREYVFRGFAESQEFSNLCDSYGVIRGSITLSAYRDQNVGATGFIARLYTKMLGRGFDEEGLEYWCRKYLTGENTIEEVATVGFLHSQEIKNLNLSDTEFVTRMYRTFLNREPDEAGLADWVNRLETGRETRDSLVYGFTLSKEFGNIKASYGL